MGEEIDLFHPLGTLEWKECSPIPANLSQTHAVVFKGRLCVGARGSLSADNRLFLSSPDLTSWTPLSVPARYYGLSVYHSRLVLLGGIEISASKPTNKVWASEDGMDWQTSHIPPMGTARCSPSAVNTGTPEWLVAASGIDAKGLPLNVVEILIDQQWSTVHPLPNVNVYASTFLDGKICCCARARQYDVFGGKAYSNRAFHSVVYVCDLQILVESPHLNPWIKSLDPGMYVSEIISSQGNLFLTGSSDASFKSLDPGMYVSEIISSQGNLFLTGSSDASFSKIFGLRLSSLPSLHLVSHLIPDVLWFRLSVPISHLPEPLMLPSLAILPSQDMVVIGKKSTENDICYVYKGTFKAMVPYNIQDRFTQVSLHKLDAAGVGVIPVVYNLKDDILALMGLSYADDYIEEWVSGLGKYPPTWEGLLGVLKMVDHDLCQQITSYLQGSSKKQEYTNAYRQILATQESIKMRFFKVILLGAPRLGKTTFCRRLKGEIDDIHSSGEGEHPSSGALESGGNIVVRSLSNSAALVTPSEWLFSDDLADETHLLLQYFYSHVSEIKPSHHTGSVEPISIVSHRAPGDEQGRAVHTAAETQAQAMVSTSVVLPVSNEGQISASVVPGQHLALSEAAELFREVIGSAAEWKDIKSIFCNSAFMRIEDAGGQPEFMDMLPALAFGPALYLLFCKLTDDLKSSYTVSYRSPTGEITVPFKSTYTVEEVLHTSLACVACLQPSTASDISTDVSSDANKLLATCNKSIAYIVGTHKDLLDPEHCEQQIAEFDEKLQHCIRPTDFFEEDLVQFASEERMVLAIDNMHGGKSEIQKVQSFLEEGMKKFDELSIPASWLVLSLCLRKREERVATLESILQLASELGVARSEAMVALWFLHHYAGVLMYFPDVPELASNVICDNQVVYDSTTNLIVNTFRFGAVPKAKSEKFKKTGQFSLEDIKEAVSSVKGDFIPLKKLVALLKRLNIIAIIPSSPPNTKEILFMPTVLENATREELEEWWNNHVSGESPVAPLFIRYKCGFTPIGVFPAMMAQFAGNRSLKLIVEGIRKNKVQFRFGKDFDDTITFISQPKYYAIHVTRQSVFTLPTRELCSAVRQLAESTLKASTDNMNYKFHADYQLSFECPSHPGREHLCVVYSEDPSPLYMSCLDNLDNPQPIIMQSQHLIWFKQRVPAENVELSVNLSSCSAAAKFSLSNILRVLKDLSPKNYLKLSLELGLDKNTYDKFETNHPRDSDRVLIEVVDWWMKNKVDPKPSWQELRRVLSEVQPNITC